MWVTTARYAATAALGGLTAAYSYYPHVTWIPILIGMIATLGIHVVPAVPSVQDRVRQPPPGTMEGR